MRNKRSLLWVFFLFFAAVVALVTPGFTGNGIDPPIERPSGQLGSPR